MAFGRRKADAPRPLLAYVLSFTEGDIGYLQGHTWRGWSWSELTSDPFRFLDSALESKLNLLTHELDHLQRQKSH